MEEHSEGEEGGAGELEEIVGLRHTAGAQKMLTVVVTATGSLALRSAVKT